MNPPAAPDTGANSGEARDHLRRFAVEVRQLAFSFDGAGESQCLDLSERMLAAAGRAEGGSPAPAPRKEPPKVVTDSRLRPTAS